MCRTHIHENVQDDQMLEVDHICHDERRDSGSWSNFLDMDWISSSGNSCEDELCERYFYFFVHSVLRYEKHYYCFCSPLNSHCHYDFFAASCHRFTFECLIFLGTILFRIP